MYAEENNEKGKFQDVKQIKNKIAINKCTDLRKFVKITIINSSVVFIKKEIINMIKLPSGMFDIKLFQVHTLRKSSKHIH